MQTLPTMDPNARALWRSIAAARYDFGAVGAALFSIFGLVAAGIASAHVVSSLFAASIEATIYGVALFALAEGVAYFIEGYALFEGRLRWWLVLLRWVGPLLSAAAGGLAAYGWLPDAYKGLAVVTTIVVPLFQWGFLSLLMERIKAVHKRRVALESQGSAPAPEQQLITIYREIQHRRSLDDLARLEAMITFDAQPTLVAPRQPAYPAPVEVQSAQDTAMTQQDAMQPHPDALSQQEAIAQPVTQQKATNGVYVCPNCGATLANHGKWLAAKRWQKCAACK